MTANISVTALLVVVVCLPILAFFNWRNVSSKSLYIFVGIVMWIATLKSGVHATLAGVILAMFIPLKADSASGISPLKSLEQDLHSLVVFFILPVFAFANAGIRIQDIGLEQLTHGVPLGIAFGLLVGKQAGIFGFCWLAWKLKIAEMPHGMSVSTLYGAAALCGIGFTMSLFIGSLAFEETGINLIVDERLGILVGSVLSGLIGYLVLRSSLPSKSIN